MSRKWMLPLLIILGVALISVGLIGVNMEKSDDEDSRMLPIPVLLVDENEDENIADYNIVAQQGQTSFFNNVLTPTLGYNGSFLGPVIRVRRGELVNMHVQNDLSDDTSVHWHGLEVSGASDGGPHQVISPGTVWQPSFVVDQPAATLWFHPHVIGSTAIQVYEGLAGLMIVEDEHSDRLNIPKDYGVNDIPLIIQDRSFNRDGSFDYSSNMMDGVLGDTILVNGAITPTLKVDQINMRFRLVNGANARNFDFELSNRGEFYQIASDGGFLEKPVKSKRLFLSPGERAEIIVDFSAYNEGDVIFLKSGNIRIMTFVVGKESVDTTEIPETLVKVADLDVSKVTGIKTIELDGMGHMVSLNGRQFDIHRIDDNVALDAIEIWEITTLRTMMGGMGHPFHIHGTQFQVLSRNGREPDENERGFKDTVFVGSGETVRIIVQFKHKGIYMYHCHILEHEEAGMMGQLEVE
ncbi:MAG: multicopper oxidase domain-containing protein [Erysipelothrix sp.]|nr:multicopper oxidase domain-containing protein [Erysipelothrix sp.]